MSARRAVSCARISGGEAMWGEECALSRDDLQVLTENHARQKGSQLCPNIRRRRLVSARGQCHFGRGVWRIWGPGSHPGGHSFPEKQRQPRRRRAPILQGQSIVAEVLVISNQCVVFLGTAKLIPASVVFFDPAPAHARQFADGPPHRSVPGSGSPGWRRGKSDLPGAPVEGTP